MNPGICDHCGAFGDGSSLQMIMLMSAVQSKKQPKRYEERDKADAIAASRAAEQDQPLDDPLLEKLRQQR